MEPPPQPARPQDAPPIAPPTADATEIAKNPSMRNVRPTRSPAVRANPDDEKEQVELTLTKPAEERLALLKDFIVTHPKSAAVPRAQELIVAAHATLGDKKLAAGCMSGGVLEIQLGVLDRSSA